MTNLSKEYFNTKIKKLEDNLKKHTTEQVGELVGMVGRRFDEVEKKLDLREEVDKPKVQMKKVWEALNIAQK